MIPPRMSSRCILRPGDLAPSQDDMHVVGVFNPGAAAHADGVVLLARVAESPRARAGWVGLPRWNIASGRIETDWLREEDVTREDMRSVRLRRDGSVRLTFASHLCVLWSRDGLSVDGGVSQRFIPELEVEAFGVEDPRITPWGDQFLITYVAVSMHGPATALALTRDFRRFERRGVIFCPDNKDVVILPERVGGDHMAVHRPSLSSPLVRPEMWIASSPDLRHWGGHLPLYGGREDWENARVGAGTPPLRTAGGWLLFYHGKETGDVRGGSYRGGLLLLDAERPWEVRGRAGPVMIPQEDFEREGFVPDVVFPTGIVRVDDTVRIYYGAADSVTGVCEYRLRDLEDCLGHRY